jgi:hypothetical protein
MGYAWGGGGRPKGLALWAGAGGIALILTHALAGAPRGPVPTLAVPALPRASAGPVAAARTVRVVYRDGDGRWRVAVAHARGAWRTASAKTWRRAMPGMRVGSAGGAVVLTEAAARGRDPYYLDIRAGRVGVWAGRPGSFSVQVATTPLLAGALDSVDIARLEAAPRVPSVAAAWRRLSALGA